MRSQIYYYLCLLAVSYAPLSTSAATVPIIAVADLQRQLSNQTSLKDDHPAHFASSNHSAHHGNHRGHHRHHRHRGNHTAVIEPSSVTQRARGTLVARVARPFGVAPVVLEARDCDDEEEEEGEDSSMPTITSTKKSSSAARSTSTRTITTTTVVPMTRITTRVVTQVTGTSTRVLTFTNTITRTATTTAKPASSTASTTSKASSTSTKSSAAPTSTNTSGQLRTLYQGKTSGDATFYGDDYRGGNCMLARPDLRFAAWPGVKYGKGTYCGACVKVTGSAGTQVVQVTDQCPECAEGALDLSTSMFKRIVGDESIGRAKVSWEFVDCVDAGLETGRLTYYWKSGSSQWWAGIQVRGGGPPIDFIEVRTAGSSDFVKPARTDYNYFVSPNGFGTGPFTIRTTFQDGSVKTDTNVPINGNIED